jgi:iron complex transport system substrate-binding protein
MIARVLVAALALVAASDGATPQSATKAKTEKPLRIVSVGSSVTETLVALGMKEQIVAVDLASNTLEGMNALPSVGYHRTLAAEGVFSLAPDLIIMTTEGGPPPVIAQISAARIRTVVVDDVPTREGAKNKIAAIAAAVGRERESARLIADIDRRLDTLVETTRGKRGPRVLFVYARGNGALMVSGRETAADGILALAGAKNVVDGYAGYRPLSAEAMIVAAPDIIVVPERALPIIGGVDGLLKAPGVSLTPAGRARRILAVDDVLMLGFGPRVGVAAETLRRGLDGG